MAKVETAGCPYCERYHNRGDICDRTELKKAVMAKEFIEMNRWNRALTTHEKKKILRLINWL